jgi:hypothetical protein
MAILKSMVSWRFGLTQIFGILALYGFLSFPFRSNFDNKIYFCRYLTICSWHNEIERTIVQTLAILRMN